MTDNPVNTLHHCLAHAIYEGFPEIQYEDRDWSNPDKTARVKKSRKHRESDVTVTAMFPQTWSSTALGFGGLGGQAITPAYTVVIESNCIGGYLVYFGGRFAYFVKRPNEKFYNDMYKEQCMSAVKDAEYERSSD